MSLGKGIYIAPGGNPADDDDMRAKMLVWMGQDPAGTGNYGLWAKRCWIGWTNGAAPITADQNGNVTINDATFNLILNGLRIEIANVSYATEGPGMRLYTVADSPGSMKTVIAPGYLNLYRRDTSGWPDAALPGVGINCASGYGFVTVQDSAGSGGASMSAEAAPGGGVRTFDSRPIIASGPLRTYGDLIADNLPSSNPGAGSKKFWYDPSDGNRVKFSP